MKKLVIFLVLIVIAIGVIALWYQHGLQPADPADTSEKSFVIPRGQPLREIANDLKEEKLINDPVVFFLLVKQKKLDQKIQAGNFLLSPSMSAPEIAEMLTKGVLDVWVTIPEGKRSEEVAEILKESIPSYVDSWENELVLHEGYLFPDTYLIPLDGTIDQIVQIMRTNFDNKYDLLNTSNTSYSQDEIVTIASLIEREAKHDEDRPLIASVIENRLDLGMALQIDATIQYAKGVSGNWWAPVTVSEYQSVRSPYNTYLRPGLPPGPIANPGIDALEAAVSPASTDYLYYIADQNGINRYASTLEGHNENIERYVL